MATTFAITSGDIEGILDKSVTRQKIYPFEKGRVFEMIKSNADPNLYVDGLDYLVGKQGIKDLKKKLVDKYNAKLPGAKDIQEAVKISQGLLMDSMVFCYNKETGAIDLYTLNERIIGYLGVDNDKLLLKTYDLNQQGIAFCYRIDIEYNSPDDIVYKAVTPNKNTYIYLDKYILFPYDVIKAILDVTSSILINNGVLKIEQNIEGTKKVRYLTNRDDVLKKYCDNPDAVSSLKTSMYPLKGYMYAPVLGAPSTTAMMSKVNVFSLESIHPITDVSKIPVKKAENPVESLLKVRVIAKRLSELQLNDPVGYSEIISRLPRVKELIIDEASRTLPSQVAIAKYLNSLSGEDLDNILKSLDGTVDVYNKIKKAFNKNENVDFTKFTDEEFKKALKTGVYNIIATKKDCSFTSMIVTNSETILRMLYGKDYIAKYESFNYRFNCLVSLLKSDNGANPEACLKFCGFDEKDTEVLKDAEEIKKGNEAEVREKWMDASGTKRRSAPKTDSVLARSCFASIDEDGKISEFYKYVTLKRVARMIKLG